MIFQVLLLLLVWVSVLGYGFWKIEMMEAPLSQAPSLRVVLVQANIPQEEKWVEELVDEVLFRHLDLAEKNTSEDVDLVVWPEAAYPAILPPDSFSIDLLKDFPHPLLIGILSYTGNFPLNWPPAGEETFRMFNSAVLLDRQGILLGKHDKTRLVPLGEYIPFQKWLSFVDPLSPFLVSFSEGAHLTPLVHGKYRLGITICYEDLFPEVSRAYVKQGVDVLFNLTNDAWYNRSSAIYQHFSFSRFRAVENRRSLVRATNTGVSGVFSPTGKLLGRIPPFGEGTLTLSVPVLTTVSFYTRYGDWFVFFCIGIVGLVVAIRKIPRQK